MCRCTGVFAYATEKLLRIKYTFNAKNYQRTIILYNGIGF